MFYWGYRESKCLNAKFKPRFGSAGTTMCWAPIVIRLGRLFFGFVWILFLDLMCSAIRQRVQ